VRRPLAAFFGLCFVALIPSSLFAQDKVDVYTGFSYMLPAVSVHEQVAYCPVEGQTCSVPPTIYTNREGLMGWEVSASHHFTPMLGLTADATGNYGLATSGFPRNARTRQHTFLGGPQIYGKGRFAPYAHALFGATNQAVTATGNNFFITFPGSQWGFAGAFGGGFDVKISPTFSFRLFQADYMLTRLNGTMQGQARVSTGFIFSF
jgi:hypothetical protein